MMMNSYRRGGFLSNLPPVTRGLLVANVVVFILSMLAPQVMGINLTRYLALYNFQSEWFSPFQLITHMFMHGSMSHIFFNMFGLFLFGRVLETVLGGQKFFILYVVSGLAAAFLQLGANSMQINDLMHAAAELRNIPSPEAFWELAKKYNFDTSPDVARVAQNWINFPENQSYAQQAYVMCERMVFTLKSVPMVGASGAVLGVLAAFAVMFPNVELMIIFLPIPIKAKYLVPFYAVAELFLGVANFQFDNIAHFAHLGGAIAGFVLVMYWKRNQFRDKLL